LAAAATLNFFYLMFAALYLLYVVRVLHIRPGLVGVLIGAGAIGAVLGSLVTKRLAVRIGTGSAYAAGCLLYTAPLVLWPLAHGAMPLVLAMLFAAEFVSGFGLMVLDITIGVIFAAIIPDTLRSRVTGAFQAVNRDPAARHAARRAAGQRGGTAARVVGGHARRRGRVRAAAAHSPAALPATRGGRSGASLTRCRRAGRPGSSSTRSPG